MNDKGILITTVVNGKCHIKLEVETMMNLKREKININLPKPSIWTFTKNYIKTLDYSSLEYVIDYQIEGDYYGFLVIDKTDIIPLRVSDACLILDEDIPKYINSDLIEISENSLQLELDQAIADENYALAAELKKKIKLEEKEN